MEVKLLDCTTDAAWVISYAARTCYNSNDKDDISKRGDFIKGLIKSGHEAPLEFANASFELKDISRVCQNQIVRHRIGCSYCVLSERYVDVSKMDCVLPVGVLEKTDSAYDYVNNARKLYKKLIDVGVSKEDARMILPQGLTTRMCVNMNFRAIRHFLKLRLARSAQYEVRQVAKAILEICQERWPWLVDDLKYE